MDRSFLSDAQVIGAARNFVCIRLATYEDAEEALFLKGVHRTRSGELENSVFAIFDPQGKKQLVRSGRSPRFAFRDAKEMATKMAAIAKQYPSKKSAQNKGLVLPYLKTARLGLNVAAADAQRLVVAYAVTEKSRTRLDSKLKQVVWSDAVRGQFLYVASKDLKELKALGIDAKDDGELIVVVPGEFGLKAQVITRIAATSDVSATKKALAAVAKKYPSSSKNTRKLMRQGRRQGVFWKTAVPVTDQDEKRARRGRKEGDSESEEGPRRRRREGRRPRRGDRPPRGEGPPPRERGEHPEGPPPHKDELGHQKGK